MSVLGLPTRYILYMAVGIAVLVGGIAFLYFREDDADGGSSDGLYTPERHAAAVLVPVVLGGLGVVFWGLSVLPTIVFVFYALVCFAGLLIIPILSYVRPPNVLGITETLAGWLFIVAMVGVRRGTLTQTDTGEYVIERADADLEPKDYWTRWALAPFGITFEATEDAFAGATVDRAREMEVDNLAYDGGTATIDLDRGDRAWFVTENDRNRILVPIGQKLSELKRAAGPKLAIDTWAEAMGEYGGDTSSNSVKVQAAMMAFMAFMGLAMGYVVFF